MRKPNGFARSESFLTCKLAKPGCFCQLHGAALADFDAIKSLHVHPSRHVLFTEEEQPRGIFILCEGRIKLSVTSKEGRTLILRVVNPGEVLGLMAVMGGLPHEVTAETLRPSQVAFVRKEDFLNFIRNHPDFYTNVLRHILSWYQHVGGQLRILGLSSTTPMKLARVLLNWSAENGQAEKPCSQIEMPLTHEEIGEFIGATRETVTRAFGDFKDRRLISMRGASVTIHDRQALEEVAGVRPQVAARFAVTPSIV
jgi:CRP/FNR family transcriptional regulator, cyclic AMP receptor protein